MNENKETKKYPIKDFLLTRSRLVKFNEKEEAGGNLNKKEETQQHNIYKLKDEVFSKMCDELRKYYERAIDGNYKYDGMPEIERGIRGWMEAKIWNLLIAIGEPKTHLIRDDKYWEER